MLGMSTGCFKNFDMTIIEKVKEVKKNKIKFIEIMFVNLNDFLKFDYNLKYFDKISIHLPYKGIIYGDNENTKKALKKMSDFDVNNFVIHPNVVEDWNLFKGMNILIENMGNPKKFGCSLNDIKKLMNRTKFNFCLDLDHLKKSGQRFEDFISLIGNRIKLVHVSEFTEKEDHSNILSIETLNQIIKLHDIPMIVEWIL